MVFVGVGRLCMAAVGIEWICAVAVLRLPFAFCVNYCGSIGSDGWYEW